MFIAKMLSSSFGRRRGLQTATSAAGWMLYPVIAARAQSGSGSSGTSDSRLAANPQLRDIVRITPSTLPLVLKKLDDITTGAVDSPSRGDAVPTAAERAQLSRNPAFAAAFARNPDETLRLLRWTNATLAKPSR